MTTAQPLQIPFTEFYETGNFIHSQTTKLPKFQENTQNIWNFQSKKINCHMLVQVLLSLMILKNAISVQ